MANTTSPTVVNGLRTWGNIDTNASINFGNADGAIRSAKILEIRKNGASFSAVVRKKITGSAIANGSALAAFYEDMAVATTASTAAITDDALIRVPIDGCDCIITFTMSSGAVIVEERDVVG